MIKQQKVRPKGEIVGLCGTGTLFKGRNWALARNFIERNQPHRFRV